MHDTPEELKHVLARHDQNPRSLALKLRKIVLEELAPCHEYIFAMRSKVVFLYSASEKVIADGICNIGVFRQHVTLTFVEGIELEDPRHLLQGTGKIMRHVRINTSQQLAAGELRDFLRQARSLAGLPSQQGKNRDRVTTRVKRSVTPLLKPHDHR